MCDRELHLKSDDIRDLFKDTDYNNFYIESGSDDKSNIYSDFIDELKGTKILLKVKKDGEN